MTFAADPSMLRSIQAWTDSRWAQPQNMREWCIVSNVKNSGLAWHRVGMGDVLMAVNGQAVLVVSRGHAWSCSSSNDPDACAGAIVAGVDHKAIMERAVKRNYSGATCRCTAAR